MTQEPLTESAIEQWRIIWQEASTNAEWLAYHAERDAQRQTVQQELLQLLDNFLHNRLPVLEVKNIFDKRTRTEWDVFGLKGTSGAMFLNKMVLHVPESAQLTTELQRALTVPADASAARSQMQHFFDFLTGLIDQGIPKQKLSPGYTPFFLSAWWHMQAPEQWPVYYMSGRRALGQHDYYTETADVVANYFAFRPCFLQIANALQISSWQLEHLFSWESEQRQRFGAPDSPPVAKESATSSTKRIQPASTAVVEPAEGDTLASTAVEGDEEPQGTIHTQIQWLLARLGRRFRCKVWIAANDHSRQWEQNTLGELSIDTLPALGLSDESQRIISLIDVLWIRGSNQVVAAFEIESTTSIYSGLLRMADLTASSPNLNFPLYIVAPENRLDKVRRELSRPTFQYLELNQRCGYFSFEALLNNADMMLEWATEPAAIERLAQRVGDLG